MVTKEEIKEKYRQLHDSLTKEYYKLPREEREKLKDVFEAEHQQIWEDYRNEMLQYGYFKKYFIYTFQKLIDFLNREVITNLSMERELTLSEISDCEVSLGNWKFVRVRERYEEVR